MGYLARRVVDILHNEGGVTVLFRKAVRYPLNIARGWYYAMTMCFVVRGIDPVTLAGRVFTSFYGLIRPLQNREELAAFIALVHERKPSVVLEIGTATGGTLFLLSRAATVNALIISIDLPCGQFGGGYPAWRIPLYRSFAIGRQKMRLLRADSHSDDTFDALVKILAGRKIDVLYIDGDHSYEGVKSDFERYASLVGRHAIVAFHDIAAHPAEPGCNVHRFWEEVKGSYRHKEIIADRSQVGCGIGVLFVD